MSRWRAAPPTSMEWEPPSYSGTFPYVPGFARLSHFSSPLSLTPYKLLGSPREHVQHHPSVSMAVDQSNPPRPNGPTLPVELYRMIIQHITSTHDLCTLARVSRAFQVEAERVLYHTLVLRHHIKTIWRCESLATQPRLALNVRRLSIVVDQYTPLDCIARALNSCVRLRSLVLKGAVWSDYSKVLDAVSSTEIKEFACHAFRGEAGVLRFLERQPELTDIDFEAHAFDLEELSPFAVTDLQYFTGWLTTAAALVPGRPVQRLILKSDMTNDATIRAIQKLSLGLGDVLVLDIRLGVLRNPIPWTILESIFFSLRGLRFLGVCSLDCARHPSFLFYLMGLSDLQTLVFGTGTDDFGKYDERVQRDMVRRMGEACSSLVQVIVSLPMWRNDWIWTRQVGYADCYTDWHGVLSREPVDLEELAKRHILPNSH